jgi:hypothetical protein
MVVKTVQGVKVPIVLNELNRQIVSILRYLAGPGVGLVVALMVDGQHKSVKAAAEAVWPWTTQPSSLWLLAGILALTGVTVYSAHRILFHPLVTKGILAYHLRGLKAPKPTVDDLAFARFERRGAADHTAWQSVQSALDGSNAAAHFFYCSGWSSLLIVLALKRASPNGFEIETMRLVLIVGFLFLIAVRGDWQTAKWDLDAYYRYNKCTGGRDGRSI